MDGYRAIAFKKIRTWHLQKALHLGSGVDASSIAGTKRNRLKNQIPCWCNPAMKVYLWPEGPRPLSPPPAPFLRWDDLCFRKEEPYQHRPAMFSTSGEDAPKKTKWWGEASDPLYTQSEVTRVVGYQALSDEDKIGHQSLKLCPASLVLTQYDTLSSSDISTYINEKNQNQEANIRAIACWGNEMKFSGRKGRK